MNLKVANAGVERRISVWDRKRECARCALSSARRLSVIFFLSVAGRAADDEGTDVRARNTERVSAEYVEHRARFGGNEDCLVLPGLLADRKAGRIQVRAEATGLAGDGIVEFLLIGERSSHAYEALAVAFARPSDIHKALCFIGMTPGRPPAPASLQFWPKGERVWVWFSSESQTQPVRAEYLMLDQRTGRPLDAVGFVFTGSTGLPPGEAPGEEIYAADARDPMSIIANYNERESVLDVPRQAAQSEVYRNQVVNSNYVFDAGELIEIVMEPEYKDGRRRVTDLFLDARPAPAGTNGPGQGAAVAGPVFDLSETAGPVRLRDAALPAVLKEFTELVDGGRDPFVTLRFDARLSVDAVHRVCSILGAIDTESGIRIEAPPEGQLYYRAFLPQAAFTNREERVAQPWELRLKNAASGVAGVLTRIDATWGRDDPQAELTLHHFETPTPEALRAELDRQGPGLPVILIFADPRILHGQLLDFIRPVLPTHGTVYVFTGGESAR